MCHISLGFLGTISHIIRYKSIPLPKNNVMITNKILNKIGSFSKYSPKPPHTPPILRSSSDKYSFFILHLALLFVFIDVLFGYTL